MKELTDSEFDNFIKSNKVVVVDFWAEWCGPCRIASPIFDALSKEFAGKAEFAKVNVDENPQTSQNFSIMSIPTFKIFKNGEEAGEINGALPKDMFKARLEELI